MKLPALVVLSLGFLTACHNPEDDATKAAITYAAPFLAVSEGGDCGSKLKVAQELYKLEVDRFPEIKALVAKSKSDPKFKAKLTSEVERIQNGAAAKGFSKQCPNESKELAKVVADTAAAIDVTDMVPAWTGEAK